MRHEKLKGKSRDRDKARAAPKARRAEPSEPARCRKTGELGHVSGAELCESVRRLGLRQFGSLAAPVFGHWGVRSTSDIGDIVYNLIEAGDLEKTPADSRADFDDVYDFETALKPKSLLDSDEDA